MEIKNNEKLDALKAEYKDGFYDGRNKEFKNNERLKKEADKVLTEIGKQKAKELGVDLSVAKIYVSWYDRIGKVEFVCWGRYYDPENEEEVKTLKQEIEKRLQVRANTKENFKAVVEAVGEDISYRDDYRRDFDGNAVNVRFETSEDWGNNSELRFRTDNEIYFSFDLRGNVAPEKVKEMVADFKAFLAKYKPELKHKKLE